MPDDATDSLLLLHGGALGDCTLAIHFARALGRHLQSPVWAITRSRIGGWYQKYNAIAEWIDSETADVHRLFADEGALPPRLEKMLRSARWVLNFFGTHESLQKTLHRLCGRRLLSVESQAAPGTQLLSMHMTKQWKLQVLHSARGCGWDDMHSLATMPDPSTTRGSIYDSSELGPNILVHPGSGGAEKRIPIELLERLVGRLSAIGGSVQWMIGPDEWERDGQGLMDRLLKSGAVLYCESVLDAAERLKNYHTFIGNDAGMTHVAAQAGLRTIVFFGPTSPEVWSPIGRDVHCAKFPQSGDAELWTKEILGCCAARCAKR